MPDRPSRRPSPSSPSRVRALLVALTTLVAATLPVQAPPARAGTYDWQRDPWVRDYHFDFTAPLQDDQWGRYGWGDQPVGNGAMGRYDPGNTYVQDGVLNLRTIYANGSWTSAGVSGDPSFAVAGGKWQVRARMPVATGIGYCFLLYPDDHSWPPEVDIAEGRVNGAEVDSTYHWGADNQQATSVNDHVDTHQWHTYGVIFGQNQIIFTLDGDNVTGVLDDVPVTDKKMWIGFQTGAMDPDGSASGYETVPGGVPNALTPASSSVQIMWVAHYHLR